MLLLFLCIVNPLDSEALHLMYPLDTTDARVLCQLVIVLLAMYTKYTKHYTELADDYWLITAVASHQCILR